MNRTFWVVLQKEWLMTWRDKRSLWINIGLTVIIMPLLMLGPYFIIFQSTVNDMVEALPVAISGLEESPSLQTFIASRENSLLHWESVEDVNAAVESGEYQIGLIVPQGFEASITNLEPAELQIVSLSGQQLMETNTTRLQGFLEEFTETILQKRLNENNLPEHFTTPFTTSSIIISPPEGEFQRSYLGWIAYTFVAMYVFNWTSGKSIDLSSGEKERQTIESILFTPAHRGGIVLAKMAYIILYNLLFVGLGGISILVTAIILVVILAGNLLEGLSATPQDLANVSPELSPEFSGLPAAIDIPTILVSLGWLLALTAIMLLLFIAMQMTIGYWARSENQAVTILGFGNLLVIGLSFVLFNSNYIPALWHYAIPLYNNAILFSLLASGSIEALPIGLTIGSNLLTVVLLTGLNAWMLNREEIVSRT